jgi:predicted ATP-dependent serine protease
LFKSLIESNIPFSNLQNHSITEDHFKDRELVAYRFVRQFILEYGQYPTTETVGRHISDPLAFSDLPAEVPEYWIAEVQKRKRYEDMHSCMLEMRREVEDHNIENALELMGKGYLELRESYSSRRMVDIREIQREVLEKHDEAQSTQELQGVSFGFPYIDAQSGGAQNGDYVVIVGQTGVGKTYLALKVGKAAHSLGKNVIFLSTEMPNLQTARRVLALEGRFSTTDLKKGRLSYFGRERAERIIEEGAAFDGEQGNYFQLLPGGMFPKVEDLAIVVKELKPDIVIIDGAYLLQTIGKMSWWEKNMEVAVTLKNLAMNEDLPVIATYQYGKKDVGKLEGVGGGFAIPQIAGVVLSFEYERKEDIGSTNEVQSRLLKLTKGRDGESGSIRVEYNMRTTSITQERRVSGRLHSEQVVEPDISEEMDRIDFAEI